MAIRPPATIELSAADVARLVDEAFPALAPSHARIIGSGWDNAAFVVNDAFVIRFPRRPEAVVLLENEVRVLPALAPSLPLAISLPELVARDASGFPHPFAGYRRIEGVTADACAADDDRSALAEPLALFLRALHSTMPPIDRPPGDVFRKADVAHRVGWLREELAGHEAHLDVGAVLARAEELAVASAPSRALRWVHGDLYPRHLVVRDRALAGVIDWGDVHLGDPAIDLSVVFGWLPTDAQERFFDVYGELEPATRARARFRALTYGAIFARHAAESGDEGFATMASVYLAQLLG